ncbi:putative TRAP transporter large permease protein HI_0050 [Candidatus Filomicrobium marinum]|uniref:TRAP transporter large permease protein n=2 Tax=Filomicrobium TaxID=119044 RepID=A0A0D6JE43_9HYPH|nr:MULTISPECIES: TRAP transporter large permease [Filomicrobium]MCV0367906.1 TRAP transporter large permease [Filomicrobium sp.]CFX18617.1 putative TRAP transporter large permease protein HI_0050 [Candidatus Filomicrobium marinum]CPR18404.1 putative TRAP transporter large permease protein HI_0050 [Candidatus Filomicrobium marinum]SDO19802.1 C4-dicarboxylate transporter, DctM subunit [Filomicrobium insigne]
MTTATIFITLIALMMIRTPIAVALGLASIAGLALSGISFEIVAQRMFSTNNSFPLLAIPFFILAGEIMSTGGMSRRLVDFAGSLVGHFRGGLGAVAILGSSFFAALSGSNAATVAAIGSVMNGPMAEKGYDPQYTAATIAAAGVTGMIIPPSILLILYGVVTGVSIADLFLAGILPGVLICVSMLFLNWFLSAREKVEKAEFQGAGEIVRTFKAAFWPLLMPVIILSGIYGGIFTPTEAAVVAVLYGLIVGWAYGELSLNSLYKAFFKAVISSAIVMFIMNAAGVFAWLITINQIPQSISAYLAATAGNQIFYILFVNVFLLLVGCMMNAAAAIVIFTSILYPAAMSFGIDPIVFGVIMAVNLSIGTVTPPLGVDLFIASAITKVSVERIVVSIWPYILVLIIDLLLISYCPPLSTFLVNVFK